MPAEIESFRANGILGQRSYEMSTSPPAQIIVGPNGSGKSTFLNIFYLFITRQWDRLLSYNFSEVRLRHTEGEIVLSKAALVSYDLTISGSPRLRRYINNLTVSDTFNILLSKRNFTQVEAERISRAISIPTQEVYSFKEFFASEISSAGAEIAAIGQKLSELELGEIVFLPTYRRIERDLKSIFPDIEERYRSRLAESKVGGRESPNFQEIVSFGMQDVTTIIRDFSAKLNLLSKNKSNAAAQEYIRDIVRGRVSNYALGDIKRISLDQVERFVDRLDEQLLSEKDKSDLKSKLIALISRGKGRPNSEDKYLGFFVEKMLGVYSDVEAAELPLVTFSNLVSQYLDRSKSARYEGFDFSVVDAASDEEIPLGDLSSGEKQIISIFAYLLLTEKKEQIVFIDEPELSLSVPWQRTFLPDILATGQCKHLFAVTHSPFVFDNDLRAAVVDVRSLRV